jgi:protein-S-isoprenylcysteine O-methyltransferase Ste14
MTKTASTRLIKKLSLAAVVVAILGFITAKLGWHLPSWQGSRQSLSVLLWLVFGVYWAIAALNSAPTRRSESRASTYFHQLLLVTAVLLTFCPVPGLNAWFLPRNVPSLVIAGLIVQAFSIFLAVWARRHLGRNWSAEVRIAVDHRLVRTGPYRLLRHPIYTAMLGMLLGTAIVSGQYHALSGLVILAIAYVRKTNLEEKILLQTFGADYDAYRRHTWTLVPLLF